MIECSECGVESDEGELHDDDCSHDGDGMQVCSLGGGVIGFTWAKPMQED